MVEAEKIYALAYSLNTFDPRVVKSAMLLLSRTGLLPYAELDENGIRDTMARTPRKWDPERIRALHTHEVGCADHLAAVYKKLSVEYESLEAMLTTVADHLLSPSQFGDRDQKTLHLIYDAPYELREHVQTQRSSGPRLERWTVPAPLPTETTPLPVPDLRPSQ